MSPHDFTEQNARFLEWLDAELAERGWSDAEIARRGDFYATSLTHIRKGRRRPGIKLVSKLAAALNLDPDIVAAKAGLLPEHTRMSEKDEKDIQRIRRAYSRMDHATRETYIELGEMLAQRDQRRRTKNQARTRFAQADI